MKDEHYREQAIKIIDDYLTGKMNAKDASDWAQQIIVSSIFRQFPKRIRSAMYIILDLHDEGKPWCPTAEELAECKEGLISNSGKILYHDIEFKAKTRRRILKEFRKRIT